MKFIMYDQIYKKIFNLFWSAVLNKTIKNNIITFERIKFSYRHSIKYILPFYHFNFNIEKTIDFSPT